VAKHLIDIDETALSAARSELGTSTIKDTVNQALRLATTDRAQRVTRQLDVLGGAELAERDDAWR
jgi:Arc/MetJ family transcription regulator